MSDYPMLISNKLHSFRNFIQQKHRLMQVGMQKEKFIRHIKIN